MVFWARRLLAWHRDWQSIENWLNSIDNTPEYIALAMGGLLLAAVSSTAAQWLQTTVIRLAEGYWPWPLRGLRFFLARRLRKRLAHKEEKWARLADIPEERRTEKEQEEFARLDVLLSRYPVDDRLHMPTTLGNLLRSAEEYPKVRYGLDAVVCWPRLWLLMPGETLEALSEAREQLDAAARFMLWILLFTVWTIWTKWAALSLLLLPAVYPRMIDAAENYGRLVRSAFDIHWFKLYEALNWPLPPGPAEEAACGEKLTEYLFRGAAPDAIRYNQNGEPGDQSPG